MDIPANVKDIVEHVGGTENINSVSHCFTRLRFKLKDRTRADDEAIKKVPGVMGIIDAGGQLQVVIGNQVEKYYSAVLAAFPEIKAEGSVEPEKDTKQMSVFDRIVDFASAAFVPCVSMLAACGTLQGLLALLVFAKVLDPSSGTYTILSLIGNSIFYYFPVFVAYSTGKYFGGKPFFSMLAVLIMIHPTIINAADAGDSMDFLGIPLTLINYSSAVFPAILVSWFSTVVEKLARKVVPDMVKVIFVPMIVLVITIPVALFIIGPVMTAVMNAITSGAFALIAFSPALAGLIVGAAWQPLVFLGVSKAFVPVFIADLNNFGYDALIPVTFIVCALSQGAAALAYGLRTKNRQTRQVGISSFVAALFGVTEPAMFGLNVPAKRPFIFGVVGAAAGGLISVVLGGKGYSIAAGILGIPSMIGPNGIEFGFYGALIGVVVAFVLAFVLTWLFGYSVERDEAEEMHL